MTTALLIIDPQKDFIDDPFFMGALAVPGAYADMQRLAHHINTSMPDSIVVTMDTHAKMHIANPMWWVNEKNENPAPFTQITVEDVELGKWKAVDPEKQEHALGYVKKLKRDGKYVLNIWPYHCIEGTEGHKVTEVVAKSLEKWEKETGKKVIYVFKGKNPDTEMYSGLKAEVVMPEDETTAFNQETVAYLRTFDAIQVAGEAKSHCVASTTMDLIQGLGDDCEKVILLENCMSSVPGFEGKGEEFVQAVKEHGCSSLLVTMPVERKLKIS